jgi:flagellar biosynthesis/type III secretory pathway protein FliH
MIFSEMTIEEIRLEAAKFDNGSHETNAILAKGYVIAYDQGWGKGWDEGFEDGKRDAEYEMEQKQMLLMCTAGNA